MKQIAFSLFAASIMVAAGVSASSNNEQEAYQAVALRHQDDTKRTRLTPQQATDNLVKELGLNSKQAKKLRKLNEQYADLIANPRFKGKPQPADEGKEIVVDGRTGATQRAEQSTEKPQKDCKNCNKDKKQNCNDDKIKHQDEVSDEDMKSHIRLQHQKRNAYNAELKKILTKEQYDRYRGK